MEFEGHLEFSLGCLQYLGGGNRDQLRFPIILQVCDASEFRAWSKTTKTNFNTSQVLCVSDGLYRTRHAFILLSSVSIPVFTVISINNVDFDHTFQIGYLPRNFEYQLGFNVAGAILDYSIIKRGDEIGYLLGNPEPRELSNRLGHSTGGRLQPTERIVDNLSRQLWKQVKEERCCDICFIFPHLPGTPSVKAQRSALIASSPVFEVQFEGNFADVSRDIPITDTEPAYLRCILQFIFTKFVPLLSLIQAFEVLYLAKKYLIEDLVVYCKDFIMKNEQKVYGVPDIFSYFEMNQKCLDEDIDKFAWDKFSKHAKNYIRQEKFLELDVNIMESFLLLEDANCHEWELVQALRRWAVSNNAGARCHMEESTSCIHQLLECIRWETMPDKEGVMAENWPEFGLHNEQEFLVDILELKRNRQRRSISDIVPMTLNHQYSHNRKYCKDASFVIYTNLFVDPSLSHVSCLHGIAATTRTMNLTHCLTIGPPFELKGFFVVPSYNLSYNTPGKVKLTVKLTCHGKTFSAEPDNARSQSLMILTVFSFSPTKAAMKSKKIVNFSPNRDSGIQETILFSQSELEHHIHPIDGGDFMDIQMRFITDTDTDRMSASPTKILHSQHLSPHPSTSNAADARGDPQGYPYRGRRHYSWGYTNSFGEVMGGTAPAMRGTLRNLRSPSPERFSPLRFPPSPTSPGSPTGMSTSATSSPYLPLSSFAELIKRQGSSNHPPSRGTSPEYFDLISSPSSSPMRGDTTPHRSRFPDGPSHAHHSSSRTSTRSRSPIETRNPGSPTAPYSPPLSTLPSSSNWVAMSVHEGRAELKRKETELCAIKLKLLQIQIAEARAQMINNDNESDEESFSLMDSKDLQNTQSGTSQTLAGTRRSSQPSQDKQGASGSRHHIGGNSMRPPQNWSDLRYSPKYRPSSPPVIDVDLEDPSEEPARPIGDDDGDDQPKSDNNDDIADTEPQT